MPATRLYIAGGLMLCATGALAILAAQAATDTQASTGRLMLTLWGIAAGVAYVAGLWPVRRLPISGRQLIWILSVGLAMRAVVLPTAPFLEDDFYRYLWDGAVAAHGANPYQHAPADVLRAAVGQAPDSLPHALLDDEARDVLAKINHPHLTTVYGPVAQLAFAAAHVISPWSVLAWRGVLLVFDALTFVSTLVLLRGLGAPPAWAAWYWWNPLLLREVIGSGHMDVIALPLVIASLLFAIRRAPLSACLLLALAAGVKIWPVVLLPLVIRAASGRIRTALLAAGVFVATSALLWLPALAAVRPASNGFRAYALTWYNNDAIFRATAWATQRALPLFDVDSAQGSRAARCLVAGALVVWVALQTRRLGSEPGDLVRRCVLVVAVMFFLSPAQFPWYYVWMLPLLAAAPRLSLLGYAVLLPLYYVHYEHPWVVWIEHPPVLAWFVAEAWMSRRRQRNQPQARANGCEAPRSAIEAA